MRYVRTAEGSKRPCDLPALRRSREKDRSALAGAPIYAELIGLSPALDVGGDKRLQPLQRLRVLRAQFQFKGLRPRMGQQGALIELHASTAVPELRVNAMPEMPAHLIQVTV